MKKILPILMLVFLSSCDNESDDFVYREYQLPPNNGNLELKIGEEEVTLINDKTKFQEIFSYYPNAQTVDFNKYTLLLIRGISTSGIVEIQKSISKTDGGKYAFDITIERNQATVMEPWYLAYIIQKTNEENIKFTINYIPSEGK
ncbi:MAG TPA: hypothetical protein PKC55_17520 [Dysgonomonas sp.]|uniref:hypothetical protein n=1 Tax=unclassified Dysgonomonas TaxID=2630389 RepID=UPI0025BEEC6A|nr:MULTISPECIES: hypothetical protein [unclassified Dysgonomonas]HML66629.1 hypothetical protein [Dysgonomonas sp.]